MEVVKPETTEIGAQRPAKNSSSISIVLKKLIVISVKTFILVNNQYTLAMKNILGCKRFRIVEHFRTVVVDKTDYATVLICVTSRPYRISSYLIYFRASRMF